MAKAPVGSVDLGKLAQGKLANDILLNGPTSAALKKIMGTKAFSSAKDFADEGTSFEAEEKDRIVKATICLPHLCTVAEADFAFDHSGHGWASLTDDGKTTYYGNPPAAVQKVITPQ